MARDKDIPRVSEKEKTGKHQITSIAIEMTLLGDTWTAARSAKLDT